MPIFEYKGLTRDGKNVKGVLDAENLRAARTKLKKDKSTLFQPVNPN
jgi:general secretion pathway protein F